MVVIDVVDHLEVTHSHLAVAQHVMQPLMPMPFRDLMSPCCCMQLELNEYADMSWDQFSKEKLGFQGATALQRCAPQPTPSTVLGASMLRTPLCIGWVAAWYLALLAALAHAICVHGGKRLAEMFQYAPSI
jgi:hypothetical protein